MLVAQGLARGLGRGTCAMVLLLCAGNPITWRAVEIGHPEELLGGALCVGAVLAGVARKPGLAGLLLGLALANKAWGAARDRTRSARPARRPPEGARDRRCAGRPLHAAAAARRARDRHAPRRRRERLALLPLAGVVVPRGPGPAPARRAHRAHGAGWLSPIPHPLIVLLAVPLSLLAARRKADPLALLALLLLLRCVLDPWNNVYYVLPCVLALAAWEPLAYGRPPLYALATVVATFISMERIFDLAPFDVTAATYLAWSVPLAAFLAWRIYAPACPRSRRSARAAARASGTRRSSAR